MEFQGHLVPGDGASHGTLVTCRGKPAAPDSVGGGDRAPPPPALILCSVPLEHGGAERLDPAISDLQRAISLFMSVSICFIY